MGYNAGLVSEPAFLTAMLRRDCYTEMLQNCPSTNFVKRRCRLLEK